MGRPAAVDNVDVWIDEGHGRIGILDVMPLGYVAMSVSCNDGRVLGGFLDDLYKPTSQPALAVPSLLDLEPGQRVFFRSETVRTESAPAGVPIVDLDDTHVMRHFVTLTILDDGVDDPPPRPRPKTRPAPNEDLPAPPPKPKRYGPSHRDGWDYNAVIGCVVRAYNDLGDTPNLIQVSGMAASILRAADLVQWTLEHHVDRKSYAHARARTAVHAVVTKNPPPVVVDRGCFVGWQVGVALTAIALLRIADDLVEVH